MADVFSPKKRSAIMARIKGSNTKPEIVVRKLLHALGYRFRLHYEKLPGKPDIVLPRFKKVILVHGCFWHGHKRCRRATIPKTNTQFWNTKIQKTVERDHRVVRKLRRLGWNVFVIWQCQMKEHEHLVDRLQHFLGS